VGVDVSRWPLTVDVEEQFYFLLMAGVLMGSPADETPVEPHDAFANEMDIAIGADRIQIATTLKIRRIRHSWAGVSQFDSIVAGNIVVYERCLDHDRR